LAVAADIAAVVTPGFPGTGTFIKRSLSVASHATTIGKGAHDIYKGLEEKDYVRAATGAASQAPSFSLGGDSYGGYGSTALGMLNVNSFNSVGGGLQTGAYNPLAYGYDKTLFSPTGGQFPAQPSFNPFAGMFNGFNK
jgi:hypothetical protein